MLVDRALHLERGDVLASTPDGVLDPVDEVVVATLITREAVSAVEPSVAPGRRGLLRHVEIPAGDDPGICGTHHHLAEPVGPDILIVVIDQLHLEAGRTARDP